MAAQERGSGLAASERRRRYDNDRAALWMSRPELHVPGDPGPLSGCHPGPIALAPGPLATGSIGPGESYTNARKLM